MIKTIRRALCVAGLLVLAALGLLACTKEQAKTEANAIKSCLEAPEVIGCQINAGFDCAATGCTTLEHIRRSLNCIGVCMRSQDILGESGSAPYGAAGAVSVVLGNAGASGAGAAGQGGFGG